MVNLSFNQTIQSPTVVAEEMATSTYDIDEVILIIRDDFPIRTIKEELEKEIARKAHELAAIPDEYEAKRDELENLLRKKCGNVNVRNWLSGEVNSISRNSALKIAYALQMSPNEAEWFLMQSCWLDGFYLRDYKDMIHRYCLAKKIDIQQAKDIIKNHSYLDNIPNTNIIESALNGERATDFLDRTSRKIETVDDLNAFIKQNKDLFGSFRRKAYEKFMEYYNTIKKSDDLPSDEEISKIIAMGIPTLRGRQAIVNDVLKRISENALTRPMISEIKTKTEIKRKRDNYTKITEVNRKHLILIHLLVYGGNPDFSMYTSKEAAFAEAIININDDILEPCGMPLLDFRNPFDWVVLNALHYAYYSDDPEDVDVEDTDVVERINALMDKMFDRGEVE
jgi:hypothetical protein